MQRYYYVDSNNQAVGPLLYADLIHLQSIGQIVPETNVVPEGGADWQPFSAIPAPQALPAVPVFPQNQPVSATSAALIVAANSDASTVIQPGQGRSDVRAMLQYDANKKSAGVAYFLWFFFGMFGVHRFYMGRWVTALMMMFATLISLPLCLALVGYIGLFFVGLWVFIDAFLIAGWVRRKNNQLIQTIGI